MTNEEYYKEISTKTTELKRLRSDCKQIAAGIIGQSLFAEDLYFCASVDRCMNLIDGFISMLNDRNLTCAGALLRLQLDNCMRTYATFIADDKEAVVDCIISGKQINRQKSKDGKFMSDSYLKQELSKIDFRFSTVYNNASGYIHLSSKAFYQTVNVGDNYHMDFSIGFPLADKYNSVLIECSSAFIYFVKFHFRLLTAVVDSKKRFDESLEDNH